MPDQIQSLVQDILIDTKLYDKIIKENVHKFSKEFTQEILGLNIVASEELQESLQHTKETIPDQLSKVMDHTGKSYILHVEWQSDNDPAMDNRMLEYRVMLRRRYKLPVKQYVIYLAKPKSTMPYAIDEEHLKFKYHLIALQQYDYRVFLKSTLPEQKLMAIFGNFDHQPPVEVIKDILRGIEKEADGKLNTLRYIEQLRGLVQLRKLTKQFKKAMAITGTFKIEKDPFYQDGVRKGRREERVKAEKEKKEMALNLKKQKVALEIIANATGLSTEEIEAL